MNLDLNDIVPESHKPKALEVLERLTQDLSFTSLADAYTIQALILDDQPLTANQKGIFLYAAIFLNQPKSEERIKLNEWAYKTGGGAPA